MKVMVVMYTYKQLNSFNNYYKVGLYPEALDSLLKGLDAGNKGFLPQIGKRLLHTS